MDIYWSGHACFRIKGNNATVITDPYSPDLGYSVDQPSADIVTISHTHRGHSYIQETSDKPRLVSRPGEYEISGVLIIGIASFHDGESGNIRGKNTIYVMEIDEVTVCHLGDLGHILTADQLEEIDHVDVLLIPVGGGSTINAPLAAQVVRQLDPRIVVPMHYKTDICTQELEPVDRFLKEMGAIEVVPRPKLAVTKSNLPASTQVVLLELQ
jgi:L-ascorbate metabolism protein UlaG (beta-lactamase superfamily)